MPQQQEFVPKVPLPVPALRITIWSPQLAQSQLVGGRAFIL